LNLKGALGGCWTGCLCRWGAEIKKFVEIGVECQIRVSGTNQVLIWNWFALRAPNWYGGGQSVTVPYPGQQDQVSSFQFMRVTSVILHLSHFLAPAQLAAKLHNFYVITAIN